MAPTSPSRVRRENPHRAQRCRGQARPHRGVCGQGRETQHRGSQTQRHRRSYGRLWSEYQGGHRGTLSYTRVGELPHEGCFRTPQESAIREMLACSTSPLLDPTVFAPGRPRSVGCLLRPLTRARFWSIGPTGKHCRFEYLGQAGRRAYLLESSAWNIF